MENNHLYLKYHKKMRHKIKEISLPDINNSFYSYDDKVEYKLNKLLIFVFGSNLGGFHG